MEKRITLSEKMKEKENLVYQAPALDVTDVSLEQGIAATSIRFDEGEHVMQEEGWGEVDKNFGTGTGGDYEIEF